MWDNEAKLKTARKEAKRRYERESPVRNDEYHTLKERNRARKKLGLPPDAPLMKPWDHAKGKCPNAES